LRVQGNHYEDECQLGCNAVKSGRNLSTYRRYRKCSQQIPSKSYNISTYYTVLHPKDHCCLILTGVTFV